MRAINRIATVALAAASGFALAALPGAAGKEPAMFRAARTAESVTLHAPGGGPVLRYLYGKLPSGERVPAVEGTCFTHPLYTPAGEVVTDLAPADHPHHRGVFCAWVQMDGEKPGDWWGWGAKAPKDGRVIVSRAMRVLAEAADHAALRAANDWRAEGTTVVEEQVAIRVIQAPGSNVVDYELRYSAPTDKPVVIAPSPFGGFCYRARPRGTMVLSGPEGKVDRPDSIFNKAEMNWPASHWYDLSYRLADGRTNGVAVMDHPRNPPSTWHVVRGIHMLNPCIVAGGPVTIRHGEPLLLRYRLVAHDGDSASASLERLWSDFSAPRR